LNDWPSSARSRSSARRSLATVIEEAAHRVGPPLGRRRKAETADISAILESRTRRIDRYVAARALLDDVVAHLNGDRITVAPTQSSFESAIRSDAPVALVDRGAGEH